MKKLTLLFGLLTFACTKVFAQTTKEEAIAGWNCAKNYAKAYSSLLAFIMVSNKLTGKTNISKLLL